MRNICETTLTEFIKELSSKKPIPGGGGASALIGAIGIALCSMVANLTSGKKSMLNIKVILTILLHAFLHQFPRY